MKPQALQPHPRLGPRHVGKTTLARTFAKALLCVDPFVRPCGKCRSCQLIERGSHPDFRLIQPTDKDGALDRSDGTLRAEQATEIVRDVALRPLEGAYKIFLLQDMDAAHPAFANKLLKTLEEPPNRVILLVTAADRSLVLPTILSRCQIFDFKRNIPITTLLFINNLLSNFVRGLSPGI